MNPQIVTNSHNRIRLALAFAGYQIESRHVAGRRCALVIRRAGGAS